MLEDRKNEHDICFSNELIKHENCTDEKFLRILLIDDNEHTSNQLIHYLKNKGYDLTATNSVKNVVSLLLEKKFDLILLNVLFSESDTHSILESFEKKWANSQTTHHTIRFWLL